MAHRTIEALKMDHEKVLELFDEFNREDDRERMEHLVEKICENLEIHMKIEENYLYPAAAKVTLEGRSLIEEAIEDHANVKQLIAEIKTEDIITEIYHEKMKRMGAQVERHIAQEENELFPFVERELADELAVMGAKMEAVKFKEKILG